MPLPELLQVRRDVYDQVLADLELARTTAQRRQVYIHGLLRVVRRYRRERNELLRELGRPVPGDEWVGEQLGGRSPS